MKYATVSKTSRNMAIVYIHLTQPELSFKEIGQVFSISKQRVHQIVEKYNSRYCSNCYHYSNSNCACRELVDMRDPCPNWYPIELRR